MEPMMFIKRWTTCCCLCLLILSSPLRAGEDLAAQIESVINAPQYKQAHWGILVVDAEDGHTLYALNPDHLFFPASTTKLYSCSAALAALGPDYRFETPAYRRGTLKDGQLTGDLILVAQGDLTLGGDRKSTRLNSSHTVISYAVFCLKKQNPLNSSAR